MSALVNGYCAPVEISSGQDFPGACLPPDSSCSPMAESSGRDIGSAGRMLSPCASDDRTMSQASAREIDKRRMPPPSANEIIVVSTPKPTLLAATQEFDPAAAGGVSDRMDVTYHDRTGRTSFAAMPLDDDSLFQLFSTTTGSPWVQVACLFLCSYTR